MKNIDFVIILEKANEFHDVMAVKLLIDFQLIQQTLLALLILEEFLVHDPGTILLLT